MTFTIIAVSDCLENPAPVFQTNEMQNQNQNQNQSQLHVIVILAGLSHCLLLL